MFRNWLQFDIFIDREENRQRVIAEFVKPVIEELDRNEENYEFHVLPSYDKPSDPSVDRDRALYLTFRLRGSKDFLDRMRSSLTDRIKKLPFVRKDPDISDQDFKGLRNEMGEVAWSISEQQLQEGSRTLLRLFDAFTRREMNEEQYLAACYRMCHHHEFQLRSTPMGRIQQLWTVTLLGYQVTTPTGVVHRFIPRGD